jgi:NAD(P)-dependent dehydrogenase (short-subunit alcohol dehydrogenase family)
LSHFIICGHGGIGSALITALQIQNHSVTCISSKPQQMDGVTFHCLDLTSEACLPRLKEILASLDIDVVINTIGMLHTKDHLPEKNIQQINKKWLFDNITVNTLPAIHLSQALDTCLTRQTELKFIAFSARVSSISDDKLGGWYSYRMSKSMLNMYLKNLSIEWQRKFPKAIVAGYHPGTVATHLSEPFQKNVPAEKLFSPQQAATYALNVIDKLDFEDSGKLFDWKGEIIEY